MAGVCVVGAGPAGSTFAARMAQLGHSVVLLEQASFPRPRLGESLTPGVLPLLEATGSRSLIESAKFTRVRRVQVKWDGAAQIREEPREEGLLVDRGSFDSLLLRRAVELGVSVIQPARLREREKTSDGWRLKIESQGKISELETSFLADARGRSVRKNRFVTQCRTIALYGYWRTGRGFADPIIEAGEQSWYWGVPLPNGSYNALVFVDENHFRAEHAESAESRYRKLMARSSLAEVLADAKLMGQVAACDATPGMNEDCVSRSQIAVGDAAAAIDPISSSGVQKAIQTALAGAVVANTMLRRPEASDLAAAFYRSNIEHSSRQHASWAAGHYRRVAMERAGRFWQERAGAESEEAPGSDHSGEFRALPSDTPVMVSSRVALIETPCIRGEFVVPDIAVKHPNLRAPAAYLAGYALAPLVREITCGWTLRDVVTAWSDRVPLELAMRMANWLVKHGILLPVGAREMTP